MKYTLIILIFAFFVLLLYWRMRPYIHAAQRALKVVRQMQNAAPPRGAAEVASSAARATGGQLIKCLNCGTWVLSERAISPAGNRAPKYCSHACIEQAVGNRR